ncbi:MAG: hypothetical protein ACP5LE_01475 [Thermoplasmata archaeon]
MTQKIVLSFVIISLFIFTISYFLEFKKYRSFIISHFTFVAFIGFLFLNNLTTREEIQFAAGASYYSYNLHPGFAISLLSFLIVWGTVLLFWLYQGSKEIEILSARVKMHFFVLGVAFTLFGIVLTEITFASSLEISLWETTARLYSSVCGILASVLFLASLFVPKTFLRLWEGKVKFFGEHIQPLRTYRYFGIFVLGIFLNVLGGKITSFFNLPFYLDMIGTAIVAITLGPWTAATAGLITNFLLSIVAGVFYFPFAVCNITGGLLWGFLAKLGFSKIVGTPGKIFWKKFGIFVLLNGVVVGIIIAAIATVTSAALFGGFSGHGAEYIAMETQKYLGTAAGNFLARVAIEVFDKTCAIFVAVFSGILFFQRETRDVLAYHRPTPGPVVDFREPLLFLFLLVILGLATVPLFSFVMVLPATAIVSSHDWVWINLVWITIIAILGLIMLIRYSE